MKALPNLPALLWHKAWSIYHSQRRSNHPTEWSRASQFIYHSRRIADLTGLPLAIALQPAKHIDLKIFRNYQPSK